MVNGIPKEEFMAKFKKAESICWDCARACGGCSWSEYGNFTPVEGWNAEPTERIEGCAKRGTRRVIKGFIVRKCPEFVPEKQREN